MGYRRMLVSRRGMTPVMHKPASMGNSVASGTNSVFFAAIPVTAFPTTGSALTGDTFEDADRDQKCALGTKVPYVKIDVTLRDQAFSGVIEYAAFKVERATAVPVVGGPILPTAADITANGLQHSMGKYQPGRVLKFGTRVFTADTPAKIACGVNLRRFRKETIRTGDYIGIIVHNRSGASITLDYHCRYYAYN